MCNEVHLKQVSLKLPDIVYLNRFYCSISESLILNKHFILDLCLIIDLEKQNPGHLGVILALFIFLLLNVDYIFIEKQLRFNKLNFFLQQSLL